MRIRRTLGIVLSVVAMMYFMATPVWAENLGNLYYWYDGEKTEIGHWNSSPNIVSTKLNSNSAFYYSSALASARTQWNDALDLSMVVSSTGSIAFYGGTYSEIVALGTFDDLASDNNGLTYPTSYIEGTYMYGDTTITSRVQTSARCCVVDKGSTSDRYKKTATHELGHALGYKGHDTTYSTAVMWPQGHSTYTLCSRDRLHLQQVYN